MVLAITLGLATTAAARTAPVTYTVSPRFDHGALVALRVRIDLIADASGRARLQLPDHWMGHDRLWRNFRDLTVDGFASIAEDGDSVRVLRATPGGRLTVRYDIPSAIDHEPKDSDPDGSPALPWVRPDWFYALTATALPRIEGHDDAPAQFRWSGWPKGFPVDSSFAGQAKLTVGDMARGQLIGGRGLRTTRAGPLRLVIHGRLDAVPDAVLAQELWTILRAERAFFGDDAGAPYMVAAATIASAGDQSFHGVGLNKAFSLTATPGMTLEDLRPYLAHEFFHEWNPSRLGAPLLEPRRYWFSEGFTDFYMRRLLARERLITPSQFVALWNDMLRAYAASPARRMTGQEAGKAFWTDPMAEKLPYQRGALLAALWDERLRAKGASLDDVLRAQAKTAAARPDVSPIDLFAEEMAKHGVDVAPDIEAYAKRGEPIVLTPTAFAPCADVIEVTVPTFDLGFKPKADASGVLTVTQLRPDTPAARAGLRDGDVIARKRAGTNGDSTQPYELDVRSADGVTRAVSFLPQGAGQISFQKLSLRPEAAANPALCDFKR
ncbi:MULTISPECIES: peptidase [Caulobacter]|jgi:predicted metalloprotease with PDZ domain|uniref:Putative protease with the C-terminal PDZ domain containing protein n=1 Tax=Caulobacter vibrioides OR37 TaxID=1292034 RepID=R0EA72_CAUVI|nr:MULTISPECIES: peptidase [Caulobacter]ENZ82383.1 putative protease with the C-terminal PDZ domain containing protein [Caulobacter vibrioides OR37]MBQ1560316.1 hypothetical protein [Caulobacter sp.]